MSVGRLHRVVRVDGVTNAQVEDLDGRTVRVSLLNLEGPPPQPGDWLIVHAGYAIDRVGHEEAEVVLGELRSKEPDGPVD